MAEIIVYPGATNRVITGGQAVTAIFGPMLGGLVTNPAQAEDQDIDLPEVLYVDLVGPAFLGQTATTSAIQPGGSFVVPAGFQGNVSVNARTSGHKFSALCYQGPTPSPPTPQTGTFPPTSPTTLTETLEAFPYQQYNDDDAINAFFDGYNELTQIYVGWFATGLLPVYTSATVVGALLDWVAEGLYGMTRPQLGSGQNRDVGPFNTYPLNSIGYNVRKTVGPQNVTVVSDDIFKRIMTWNFYKGDGNVYNARWVKRRVMRFLIGENGSAPNIDETYGISVVFGDGITSIAVTVGSRTITGGALFNRHGFNTTAFNALQTRFSPAPTQYPLEPVLQEAIEAGVLTFPFQQQAVIRI